MQTSALPKITCHKLSKTKSFFCVFLCGSKDLFPAVSSYIYREQSPSSFLFFFRLERRERAWRALWSFVGTDRFGTMGDLNPFVPLKMTTNESETCYLQPGGRDQMPPLCLISNHLSIKCFSTMESDYVEFTPQ